MIDILKKLKKIHNIEHEIYENIKNSIIIHDIGKATDDFQNNIESKIRIIRHEILSASYKNLNKYERYSIVTHHKSIKEICDKLIFGSKDTYIKELYNMCDNLKIKYDEVEDITKEINSFSVNRKFLKDKTLLLIKGYLNYCDHLASANINIKSDRLNTSKLFKFETYNSIQKKCKRIKEDCIIMAQTGFGKTEASMYFANSVQNEYKNRPIYYVLPYTASINAMYNRFKKQNIDVGMLHNKAKYFLYKKTNNTFETNEQYQQFKKLSKQMTICTIFQIVKAFYNCKFSEMFISRFNNGIFIIDEIHCFNIKEIVYILETLKFLKDNYNINICIMSASIPSVMTKVIQERLGINTIIKPTVLENNKKRHRVVIENKFIENDIDKIKDMLINTDKKILVCVNTVKKAQLMYDKFKGFCKDNDIEVELIHGKFNPRDREVIENKITDKNSNVRLLIGTQCIEVSLNIDYDELFTEICPIDALIQRFGRINRKRLITDIKSIHIYDIEFKDVKFYDKDILIRTKEVLENINVVDENKIQEYLNSVYLEFDMKEYNKYKNEYINIINSYEVGRWDENIEDHMFEGDNYSILPLCLLDEYKRYIDDKNYLVANSLMVNVTKGQYNSLKSKECLDENNVCFLDYSSKRGLDIYGEINNII